MNRHQYVQKNNNYQNLFIGNYQNFNNNGFVRDGIIFQKWPLNQNSDHNHQFHSNGRQMSRQNSYHPNANFYGNPQRIACPWNPWQPNYGTYYPQQHNNNYYPPRKRHHTDDVFENNFNYKDLKNDKQYSGRPKYPKHRKRPYNHKNQNYPKPNNATIKHKHYVAPPLKDDQRNSFSELEKQIQDMPEEQGKELKKEVIDYEEKCVQSSNLIVLSVAEEDNVTNETSMFGNDTLSNTDMDLVSEEEELLDEHCHEEIQDLSNGNNNVANTEDHNFNDKKETISAEPTTIKEKPSENHKAIQTDKVITDKAITDKTIMDKTPPIMVLESDEEIDHLFDDCEEVTIDIFTHSVSRNSTPVLIIDDSLRSESETPNAEVLNISILSSASEIDQMESRPVDSPVRLNRRKKCRIIDSDDESEDTNANLPDLNALHKALETENESGRKEAQMYANYLKNLDHYNKEKTTEKTLTRSQSLEQIPIITNGLRKSKSLTFLNSTLSVSNRITTKFKFQVFSNDCQKKMPQYPPREATKLCESIENYENQAAGMKNYRIPKKASDMFPKPVTKSVPSNTKIPPPTSKKTNPPKPPLKVVHKEECTIVKKEILVVQKEESKPPKLSIIKSDHTTLKLSEFKKKLERKEITLSTSSVESIIPPSDSLATQIVGYTKQENQMLRLFSLFGDTSDLEDTPKKKRRSSGSVSDSDKKKNKNEGKSSVETQKKMSKEEEHNHESNVLKKLRRASETERNTNKKMKTPSKNKSIKPKNKCDDAKDSKEKSEPKNNKIKDKKRNLHDKAITSKPEKPDKVKDSKLEKTPTKNLSKVAPKKLEVASKHSDHSHKTQNDLNSKLTETTPNKPIEKMETESSQKRKAEHSKNSNKAPQNDTSRKSVERTTPVEKETDSSKKSKTEHSKTSQKALPHKDNSKSIDHKTPEKQVEKVESDSSRKRKTDSETKHSSEVEKKVPKLDLNIIKTPENVNAKKRTDSKRRLSIDHHVPEKLTSNRRYTTEIPQTNPKINFEEINQLESVEYTTSDEFCSLKLPTLQKPSVSVMKCSIDLQIAFEEVCKYQIIEPFVNLTGEIDKCDINAVEQTHITNTVGQATIKDESDVSVAESESCSEIARDLEQLLKKEPEDEPLTETRIKEEYAYSLYDVQTQKNSETPTKITEAHEKQVSNETNVANAQGTNVLNPTEDITVKREMMDEFEQQQEKINEPDQHTNVSQNGQSVTETPNVPRTSSAIVPPIIIHQNMRIEAPQPPNKNAYCSTNSNMQDAFERNQSSITALEKMIPPGAPCLKLPTEMYQFISTVQNQAKSNQISKTQMDNQATLQRQQHMLASYNIPLNMQMNQVPPNINPFPQNQQARPQNWNVNIPNGPVQTVSNLYTLAQPQTSRAPQNALLVNGVPTLTHQSINTPQNVTQRCALPNRNAQCPKNVQNAPQYTQKVGPQNEPRNVQSDINLRNMLTSAPKKKGPTSKNQVPMPNNQNPTPSNQIPKTNNQIPTTNNQIPTTKNQIPTTNNHIPGLVVNFTHILVAFFHSHRILWYLEPMVGYLAHELKVPKDNPFLNIAADSRKYKNMLYQNKKKQFSVRLVELLNRFNLEKINLEKLMDLVVMRLVTEQVWWSRKEIYLAVLGLLPQRMHNGFPSKFLHFRNFLSSQSVQLERAPINPRVKMSPAQLLQFTEQANLHLILQDPLLQIQLTNNSRVVNQNVPHVVNQNVPRSIPPSSAMIRMQNITQSFPPIPQNLTQNYQPQQQQRRKTVDMGDVRESAGVLMRHVVQGPQNFVTQSIVPPNVIIPSFVQQLNDQMQRSQAPNKGQMSRSQSIPANMTSSQDRNTVTSNNISQAIEDVVRQQLIEDPKPLLKLKKTLPTETIVIDDDDYDTPLPVTNTRREEHVSEMMTINSHSMVASTDMSKSVEERVVTLSIPNSNEPEPCETPSIPHTFDDYAMVFDDDGQLSNEPQVFNYNDTISIMIPGGFAEVRIQPPGNYETNKDDIIDLTCLPDMDPEEIQRDFEMFAIKKEEPLDEDQERVVTQDLEQVSPELPVQQPEFHTEEPNSPFVSRPEHLEENVLAVHSPADSGIASPPILDPIFNDRKCICGQEAQNICSCNLVMYCSVKCQMEHWGKHRQICCGPK